MNDGCHEAKKLAGKVTPVFTEPSRDGIPSLGSRRQLWERFAVSLVGAGVNAAADPKIADSFIMVSVVVGLVDYR